MFTDNDRQITGIQAIQEALAEEMRRDPNVVVFGEGIGERGGCFGQTKGLWNECGPERLIDTPISELAFTGMGIGASMAGLRPVIDLMYIEFMMDAAGQVVHQAAKVRYMSGGQFHCPLVLVAAIGRYNNAGPHHSGCYYPMFMHVPGLIVVVPSSARDLKGLLKSSIRSDDPVLFLEHKSLFSKKMAVPEGEFLTPLGQANVCRVGTDASIVAIGQMVEYSLAAATSLAKNGIEVEVIDPRTLVPLDEETVVRSVQKTRRLLVIDEAHETCNAAAEIATRVIEKAFDYLDAPIVRLSGAKVHVPYAPPMEQFVAPSPERIEQTVKELVA
ncbi:MAG TPA: alpha-ketoacid dehydrogenase subunit beta [Candidatus Hydrogenedentes bacterium]|nr:alpha-ketoacid dehydrogenase subunit beta [Candidatus Hydrogenedentota bacterium]